MFERQTSPDVFGIENEYSVLMRFPGDVVYEIVGECHSVDAKLGLHVPEVSGAEKLSDEQIEAAFDATGICRTGQGMLSNGGRFYMDPSGPEYATPETSTAEAAVHRSFEGDKILMSFLENLRKQGAIEGYQANRRVVDHNGSSRGVHLNTTTSTYTDEDPEVDAYMLLATLNVAKGAIFGSGGLLVDKEGNTHFHHSPRLSVTDMDISHGRHYTNRPLVRTPFKAEGFGIARVESITSDALNFAWPMRASLVITNSLLKLIELGRAEELPILQYPTHASRVVGRYGYEHKVDILDNEGKELQVFPLDILRGICEVILLTDEMEDFLSKEARQVIPEIIDVSDRTTADPTSVAAQVESIARLTAIEKKMEKHKLGIDSERLCKFDYYWDLLGGGFAEGVRAKGKTGWQGFASTRSANPSKKLIATPPQDTRAKIRAEEIIRTNGANDSKWHLIDTGKKNKQYCHPLATKLPGKVTLGPTHEKA